MPHPGLASSESMTSGLTGEEDLADHLALRVLQCTYLVSPFLSTKSLLSLSSCSKFLLPYRCEVRRLRLNFPPVNYDHASSRLLHLVSSLRHLEYLRLEEMRDVDFLTTMAEVLKAGVCPKLERLIVGSLRGKCGNSAAMVLASTIKAGGLKSLRQLDFKNKSLGSLGLGQLADSLLHGGCPNLVSLDLSCNLIGNEGVAALAEALVARGCPRLAKLHLLSNNIGDAGAVSVARALASGGLSELRCLTLGSNSIREVGATAVSGALEGVPLLEHLSFNRNDLGVMGCQQLATALTAGMAGKELRYLGLTHCRIRDEGATSLFNAFESGATPYLDALDLTGNEVSAMSLRVLSRAIKGAALAHLKVLILSTNRINESGARELVGVLKAGACPAIRHINVWGNQLPKPAQKSVAACLNLLGEKGLVGVEVYY